LRYVLVSDIFLPRYPFLILLTVLLVDVTGTAYPQDRTGDLQFSVRDSLGEPIPGVNVAVTGEDVQGVRRTVSDSRGRCVILDLPPGVISVRLSHPAYNPIVIDDVRVQLGRTSSPGTISMSQRVHDLPELVVSAGRMSMDVNSTTYGSNLRPAEVADLPLSRNYKDVVAMLPLSNSSYFGDAVNIGGATGAENKYVVDGIDVTDPLIQSSATALPYNFVREVEVRAGGYESDSRSALGGVLNVITYAGTNELHGSVFGFYTSNRFAGEREVGLSDPTQGGFSNYDVGFSLGGPIVRDELWFFAAYNPTFANRDVEVPGYGISVDRTRVHSFAGKLTWRVSDRLRCVLTATGDPSTQDAVGRGVGVPPASLVTPDSYYMDIGFGGVNVSLNGTFALGENALIEGSIARVNRHDTGAPGTERGKVETFYVEYPPGGQVWSGGPTSFWDSFRYATVGRLSATVLVGGHSLRAGVEYKVNGTDNRYENHRIDKEHDSSYYESFSKGYQTIHNNIPSLFLHDTWQVSRRLSIHAGVRWDGQDIVGSNGEVMQKVAIPLQPRMGFTFVPDDEGSQKIFGSLGRYSQEFALFNSQGFSDQAYYYTIRYQQDPRSSRNEGDTLSAGQATFAKGIPGLQGQYYDECTLGYERAVSGTIRLRVEGLYRTLRQAIDDGYIASTGTWQAGNPGSGPLADWPKAKREYAALVLSVEQNTDDHFNFLASYVLSRNYGNYGGVFDAAFHSTFPNVTVAFDDLESTVLYGKGLLPNDRTHVVKLAASYRFDWGLAIGTYFIAQTGTPLSVYANPLDRPTALYAPRGTAGRTPSIWDLSARVSYDLLSERSPSARIILDVFQIASRRAVVDVQQWKGYLDANGQFTYQEPTYGQAYRYQPPMSVRLGMEVNF
jgi:hypothetical protein